ncbi:LysM peptidoglycan-binding domain-containing protein, partial [Myxococcota bacterium]|nr:LysM peptidoglycan-binding domain-containing protein [Myxococcota bacterium]
IAKGLGIPMEKIAAWNLLSPSAGITYNMYLLVYLPGGKKPHQALLSLEQVRLIRIDREAFFAHYLKKSHKVRIVHRVRRGDTLKKLARRYGTTRRFIRSLNRYAKKDVSPGENLIIYAKSSTVSKSQRKKISPGEKKPLPRMKHPGKTKPAIPTLRGPKKVLHQQGMTKKPGSKASSLKRIPHRTVTPSLVSSGITENLTSKFPTDISNQKALAWRGSPAPNTSKKSKKRPQPARSTPPPKKAKKAAGHGK